MEDKEKEERVRVIKIDSIYRSLQSTALDNN